MKKIKIHLLLVLAMVLFFAACKDEHEELVGRLEGSWMITEVVAVENNPDNLSLPSSGTIQFQECANQADSRCSGKFSFDQQAEVPFGYSAYSSTDQNINILPDFNVQTSHYLTGSWEVLTLEENTMAIKGPLCVQQPDNTFKSLDVKITLAK